MQSNQNPQAPQQSIQLNPIIAANDIQIQVMNLVNMQRQIIMDLVRQLDELKAPAKNGNLSEFDAHKRIATK